MSIKDLFNKKQVSFENANSGSSKVESVDYINAKVKQKKRFIPHLDFASASAFAKFGSAELYYDHSIQRVYNDYPYDGSKKEKVLFELSSSYLDKYIFDNKYPKTTGFINFSYGGWGTAASIIDGYGLPNSASDYEYIYVRGGVHTASAGMANKPLYKTFDKSIIYDAGKGRKTTFELNMTGGMTVEFWLKKDSFDISKTEKEVILDLWNGEASSSSGYGRFTLELSGTGVTESGADTFRVTLQSGSEGFFNQAIGTSTVTTSSLSSWHHYAFSFVSSPSGVTSRMYVDGDLNEKKTLGTTSLNEVGGLLNGFIGALQTSPSSSDGATTAAKFAGKLNASLDEFRFWKTRRTSEEIYNNWHRQVGGGANTDDANIKLGLYYKFNEGIVGSTQFDSVVLDYSGRIANGSWTGYSSGARETGSAFNLSSHSITEQPDPIMRSNHPEVDSLRTELMQSGSEWDAVNTTMIYNKTVPDWIKEEDIADGDQNVKFIYQIIASYFDVLYSQITEIDKLRDIRYPTDIQKPIPFAQKLLENKGFTTNNILINTTLLEKIDKVDKNKVNYEKDIEDIKNLIYTNLYNNLDSILKSKGNEKSIRNTLRCFGIDDELVKLNVYTDGGKHYFKDKVRQTSLMKKYVNFNNINRFTSTIFQTSSVNNSFTYITGSDANEKEVNSAFTAEASIILPAKPRVFNESHFATPFIKSSVFGMHQVRSRPSASTTIEDYTWSSSDVANLQVYIERDKINSERAKFILQNYDSSVVLTSSYYPEIYSNQNWNIAVRVRPEKWPFVGNIVETSDTTYVIEFFGVNHAFGVVNNEFFLTASLSNAVGTAYLTKSKRFYVGAHLTNFTGSVIDRSDIKIGSFRMYQDYVSNESIRQHNLDPMSFGLDNTYKSSTMFAKDMSNKQVLSSDLVAIHWDFETVTGSNATGNFIVDDISSGSSDIRYGWIDTAARLENRGYGYNFPASKGDVLRNEIIFASKKQLPEVSYNSDKVILEDEQRKNFIVDDDISDNFYSLEKSMSQVISDEMIKMISSIVEFNNLIGKAVDRYRMEYKNLNLLKRLFYEKVEEDPNFDKFTTYYKWIDSSISLMTSQLFPVSARNSEQISDVVESHIFERSKYQNKFPSLQTYTATEGTIRGSSEIRYNWKFGHAPVTEDDNSNCNWQKTRKERTEIPETQKIKEIINTISTGSAPTFASSDLTTYKGSTYALRNLSRPYKISQDLHPTIHGGINYPPNKNRDVIYHLTQRHGNKGPYGQPLNVVVAGLGSGSGIVAKQICHDVTDPQINKRVHVEGFAGRYSNDLYVPKPFGEGNSYSYKVNDSDMPINIFSQSVNSGYNISTVNAFNDKAIITNIHSDTTTPTNHIPMQGPFTETWVGGHQHRHVKVNRYDANLRDDDVGAAPKNNIDNKYTREEAWRIALGDKYNSDGALGFVGPDYGGPYPDPARKAAVFYREERAKRPVNVKNIRYSTASHNIGNYRENYEIISAGGKQQNNSYLTKNPDQSNYLPTSIGEILPDTTHPMSLFGQAPFVSGNVFGIAENNRQPDTTVLTVKKPVVGAFASGSFKAYGREYAEENPRDKNRIHPYLSISPGSFNSYRLEVNGETAGNIIGIPTGSTTDSFYWNKIAEGISSAFTSSYSITQSTTSASYGSAAWCTSSTGNNYLSASSVHGDMSSELFTFAAWIHNTVESAPQDNHLIQFESTSGSQGSFHVRLDAGRGDLRFYIPYYRTDNGNQILGEGALWQKYNLFADGVYLNKWVHIAVSYNSSSNPDDLKFYINGVSSSWGDDSLLGQSQLPSLTSPSIAKRPAPIDEGVFVLNKGASINNEWPGGIDETQWWNRQLTDDEIKAVYNCGIRVTSSASLPQTDDMKAWWSYGEGSGKDNLSGSDGTHGDNAAHQHKIYDRSGTGNHLSVFSPKRRIVFKTGSATNAVPNTRPFAIFMLTASTQTSGLNATFLTNSAVCPPFFDLQNIAGGVTPVQGDVRTSHDVVIARPNDLIGGKKNRTIISSRFSAPGGIETSYPYLDVYAREYSVHNNINYRNLTVRGSGSGEVGTIRMNTHLDTREGLRSLRSRHCGKFGIDSQHGSVRSADYNSNPSFSKTHRNVGRRPTSESTLVVPVFNEDYNNAHFSSLLPRSEFQYSWITSSLNGNYSVSSGKQRVYGYTPTDGMVSSSYYGIVEALVFPSSSEIFGV